jgi:hypothetical protein
VCLRFPLLLCAFVQAVLTGTASEPAIAQSEAVRLGEKVVLDRRFADWDRPRGVPDFVARTQVSNPGSGWFRFFFDRIRAGDTTFELRLIGLSGIVDQISSEDFTAESSFATHLYTASQLTLELKAPREPSGLDFRLLDLQYEVERAQPFAIVGKTDWVDVVTLAPSDRRRMLGRAVARIIFRHEDGYDRPCTGFLISSDRMLTNKHCLGTQSRCLSATITLGYLTPTESGENLRCRRILAVDADRDMALVQLDTAVGSAWGTLALAAVGPATGRALYVLQHPGGGPQKISVAGCASSRVKLTGPFGARETFSHLCDTQGGSSGSPVLDAQTNEVVGLHYCCVPLLPDGENRAVPIDRVRDKLPAE